MVKQEQNKSKEGLNKSVKQISVKFNITKWKTI